MKPLRLWSCIVLAVQLGSCAAAETAAPADQQTPSSRKKPERPRRAPPALPERIERIPLPPVPPVTVVPVPPSTPAPSPSAPTPLNSCDAGGCWSGGTRYNGGTGDTYLDRNGRPCQRNGTWIQCF